MYEYRAKVRKIVDGDTLCLDVDLGFGVWLYNLKVRLARINTPEIKTDEGKLVAKLLEDLLINKDIIIQTNKDRKEKWGRYLVEIICKDYNFQNYNLNDWLVENNYAVKYE